MTELLTHEYVPTTGRESEKLARKYGQLTLEQFVADIPRGAVVVDAGAGLSRLGHDVAKLRADVHWINIDASYSDPTIREEAVKEAPSNLEFLAADVTKPDELSALYGKADRVYSFWLLPHLSLQQDGPARAAIAELYKLLKPTGQLLIGPAREVGQGFLRALRYRNIAAYETSQDLQAVIEDAVARTKLRWLSRKKQLISNRYGLHNPMLRFIGGKPKWPIKP